MTIFHGIQLVGFSADTGIKLLLTLAVFVFVVLLQRISTLVTEPAVEGRHRPKRRFWTRQAVNVVTTVALIVGILSIWFNTPGCLATFLGLVSAGIAFALQSVITAIAGYIVTVTNDQVFSNPVYNYSRDFPFIWDQLKVAVEYGSDYRQAEQIILEAARREVGQYARPSEEELHQLEMRFDIHRADLAPTTYYHLTPDWLEITVRFVAWPYGIAGIKDAMARDILAGFTKHSIGIGPARTQRQILSLPRPVRPATVTGSWR